MPDDAFLQLLEEATRRDCPALHHFAAQRDRVGARDWPAMITYAYATMDLGEQFVAAINEIGQARRLFAKESVTQVCLRCYRESCPGAAHSRLVRVAIVGD